MEFLSFILRSQLASMLSDSATEWLVRHASLPVMVVHDVPLSDAMREHLPPGFEHHNG